MGPTGIRGFLSVSRGRRLGPGTTPRRSRAALTSSSVALMSVGVGEGVAGGVGQAELFEVQAAGLGDLEVVGGEGGGAGEGGDGAVGVAGVGVGAGEQESVVRRVAPVGPPLEPVELTGGVGPPGAGGGEGVDHAVAEGVVGPPVERERHHVVGVRVRRDGLLQVAPLLLRRAEVEERLVVARVGRGARLEQHRGAVVVGGAVRPLATPPVGLGVQPLLAAAGDGDERGEREGGG